MFKEKGNHFFFTYFVLAFFLIFTNTFLSILNIFNAYFLLEYRLGIGELRVM
jgi:hypothetical protein